MSILGRVVQILKRLPRLHIDIGAPRECHRLALSYPRNGVVSTRAWSPVRPVVTLARPHREKSVAKTSSRRMASYNEVFSEDRSGIGEQDVDVEEIINDFRMLQHVVNRQSSRPYRYAEVQLSSLPKGGKKSDGGRGTVTVSDLQRVIKPDDNIAWRVIASRVLYEEPDDLLQRLSRKQLTLIDLMRIPGIGAKKASNLYDAGFHSLSDVRSRIDDAPLEKASQIALAHLSDIEQRIPRSESLAWQAFVESVLRKVDGGVCRSELVGSFRRGTASSSDLDFIVSHPGITDLKDLDQRERARKLLESVVQAFRSHKVEVDDPLAHGAFVYRGLVQWNEALKKEVNSAEIKKPFLARRIDIFITPWHSWPFTLLGKTGDTSLMEHLRCQAKKRGLALNEYGMGPRNDNGSAPKDFTVKAETEKDIFDNLGLDYLEPTERDFAAWGKKYNVSSF
ncbi:Nucleotidyltransferase [Acaromyces ingoldii]|uniref:DNA polymerase n=1 Tax=Acaromyces ingoldii TaxID=215250 RepID=A0A316YXW9_9BASI|nr:Nucleotidyltransferase [Acaromyces ingoldii]PWN94360.1 Nucleotidyltransferase [Acaromyces ingoldii]